MDDTGVKAPKILQKAPIFFFGSHKVSMKNDTGPIGFEGGLEKKIPGFDTIPISLDEVLIPLWMEPAWKGKELKIPKTPL